MPSASNYHNTMGCFKHLLDEDRLVHILPMPCTQLGNCKIIFKRVFYFIVFSMSVNWGAIMDEICHSNIMQRDNKKFARKLDKSLAKLAKEKNNTVSIAVGGLDSYKHESARVYIAVMGNIVLCEIGCVCCYASKLEKTNSANF